MIKWGVFRNKKIFEKAHDFRWKILASKAHKYCCVKINNPFHPKSMRHFKKYEQFFENCF